MGPKFVLLFLHLRYQSLTGIEHKLRCPLLRNISKDHFYEILTNTVQSSPQQTRVRRNYGEQLHLISQKSLQLSFCWNMSVRSQKRIAHYTIKYICLSIILPINSVQIISYFALCDAAKNLGRLSMIRKFASLKKWLTNVEPEFRSGWSTTNNGHDFLW